MTKAPWVVVGLAVLGLAVVAQPALGFQGVADNAGKAPQAPDDETASDPEADARWERLQAQAAAHEAVRAAEQRSHEQRVREAEEARLRYEADLARHQQEVEQARQAQIAYERSLAEWAENERAEARESAPAAATRCERDQQRSRRRGRGVGSVLGGIAGAATGLRAINILPVGAMLGEAIASLLDCKEQEQAETATQEAIRGGVGTTSTWTSETRPNVTGASTVRGEERLADGSQCMTVTDVVIIDGEETTAPKRMCRAPGASGYVRV